MSPAISFLPVPAGHFRKCLSDEIAHNPILGLVLVAIILHRLLVSIHEVLSPPTPRTGQHHPALEITVKKYGKKIRCRYRFRSCPRQMPHPVVYKCPPGLLANFHFRKISNAWTLYDACRPNVKSIRRANTTFSRTGEAGLPDFSNSSNALDTPRSYIS